MGHLTPTMDGKIKKIRIFPSKSFEILDIHRLMKSKTRYPPIAIIRADTKKLEILRDISLYIVYTYIIKDIEFLTKYFKINEIKIKTILKEVIYHWPIEVEYWQDEFVHEYSEVINWDIQKNCILTDERRKELVPLTELARFLKERDVKK